MRLYLVQHGDALSDSADQKRALSPKGMRDITTLARACKGYGIPAEQVIHSGKLRAAQSAEMLAEELGIPVHAFAGLDPLNPVRPFAGEIDSWTADRIVVGHLPFLERLAAFLVAGREEPPVVTFQRGGMVCLEKREDFWCILWTFLPSQPGRAG